LGQSSPTPIKVPESALGKREAENQAPHESEITKQQKLDDIDDLVDFEELN